jgi:hypothetical protein
LYSTPEKLGFLRFKIFQFREPILKEIPTLSPKIILRRKKSFSREDDTP